MNNDKAYLSNNGDMIKFQYGKWIVRFRGPYSLEYFTSIKSWDNGYIVVMAKYQHNQEPEEEYIDLVPILKDLYIDVSQFLKPIKEVRLAYDKIKEIADCADMIVNGYAFSRRNSQIRVLNLNNTEKALVISEAGKVLETTMDDTEICIVLDYWKDNHDFTEVEND